MHEISRWLTRLRLAVRSIVRRTRVDEELDEEIQSHLDREIEERLEAGLSRADATRAARRTLGNIALAREQARDVRAGASIDQLRRDLRFGIRAMIARPGFTGLAVLTMALGIGATTAVFSVADRLLFKPLPFPDAERLAAVWEVRPARNRPRVEAAPLNYVDWERTSPFQLRTDMRRQVRTDAVPSCAPT